MPRGRGMEGKPQGFAQGADHVQTVKPRRRKVDRPDFQKFMPMAKPDLRTRRNRSRQEWMTPGRGAARQLGTGPRDRPISSGTGAGASAGRQRRCLRAVLKTPGVKHPFGGPHAGESGVGRKAGPISLWAGSIAIGTGSVSSRSRLIPLLARLAPLCPAGGFSSAWGHHFPVPPGPRLAVTPRIGGRK